VRGEGVNGIRPPAVRVEKTDERLLTGVKTAGLAMATSSQLKIISRIQNAGGVSDIQYGFLVKLLVRR
jgi:hypothetical protein